MYSEDNKFFYKLGNEFIPIEPVGNTLYKSSSTDINQDLKIFTFKSKLDDREFTIIYNFRTSNIIDDGKLYLLETHIVPSSSNSNIFSGFLQPSSSSS